MERPVVGFHSGGLPEIMRNGCEGILVPRGDTNALSDALTALLIDPVQIPN